MHEDAKEDVWTGKGHNLYPGVPQVISNCAGMPYTLTTSRDLDS